MSSSSSQIGGSPSESPARERSTTRDTSVTLASNGDEKHAEQAPKKARKPPSKNTTALNGGKKWTRAERKVVWEQRRILEDDAKETQHAEIGEVLGRTALACRIALCQAKKRFAQKDLDYALSAAAPPRAKTVAKAEAQPEKRPSAKARFRAMKKPSEKVEAQPQKPLHVFSPSLFASSPVSVAQGSDAEASAPRWRMENGYRDANAIVATSASEPSSPKQEVCWEYAATAHGFTVVEMNVAGLLASLKSRFE